MNNTAKSTDTFLFIVTPPLSLYGSCSGQSVLFYTLFPKKQMKSAEKQTFSQENLAFFGFQFKKRTVFEELIYNSIEEEKTTFAVKKGF